MLDAPVLVHDPAFHQVFDDQRIGFFDEHAGPGCDFRNEAAVTADCHQGGQIFAFPDFHVVRTEGGGDVYETGTVINGDIVCCHHTVSGAGQRQEFIKRFIFLPDQVAALVMFHNGHGVVAKDGFHPLFGEDDIFGGAVFQLVLDLHIVDLRVGGNSGIGRQRPRRRCPDQQGGVRLIQQAQTESDGGVFRFFIALGDFVVSQRGAAARAVRDDLEALIEQSAIEEILQDRPFGFNEFIFIRDISVIQVHPVTDPFREAFPFLNVGEGGFFAELVEFVNAVIFDLLLVGETEFLFDFNFHRQAVGIPAAFAGDVAALHGAVAQNDIFKGTGQNVMNARFAVGGRRTFEEDIFFPALAVFGRFFKDFFVVPEFQDRLFHLVDIQSG